MELMVTKILDTLKVGDMATVFHEPESAWYKGSISVLDADVLAIEYISIEDEYIYNDEQPIKEKRTQYFALENITAFSKIERVL